MTEQVPRGRRLPGRFSGGPFGNVSRRVRALLVGGVIFVVLFVLLLTLPVPYVVLSPGPTFNTLGTFSEGGKEAPIIAVSGTETKPTTGNLNMTTVNESTAPLSAFQAIVGWLESDEVVVPRAAVEPPGTSQEQIQEQNRQDFSDSQDSAIAAASCELGYPQRAGVTAVVADGPSDGKLDAGDVITAVNGSPTSSADDLLKVLTKQKAGDAVPVTVKRYGKPTSVNIALGKPVDGRDGASLGVSIGMICQAPFEIDLGLGNQIGGPSAGLMFALGIIDKVGDDDLTDGRFIAGTGTIDPAGNVGPIGGIQLKMIAARAAGATVFLAPTDNCSDVVGAIPDGLNVVKVDTLHHAVQYLDDLENSKTAPSC